MAIFSLVLVICFLLFCFWKSVRPRHFPPGPWRLPFLGNLLHFNVNNPLEDLKRMQEKYGPVFSMYTGGTPCIFIQDFPSAKEVLLTKGTEFAGRADNPIIDLIHKKKGIITVDYGKAWKEQRKFSVMVLRNFGLGKRSMEDRILEEATYLIQAFMENMNVPLDPHCLIDSAVSNIISTIIFGKRFEYNDSNLRNLMERIHQNMKLAKGFWAQAYNEMPFLRWLPLPHQTILSNIDKFFAFCAREVEEHKATHVPGEHRDFIDVYLEEIQKPENKGSSFDDDNLFMVVVDLFLAGSETTSVTLQWALLYMMAFPEIQAKCQEEMDTVLSNNARLKYEDRENLPYTNAVIHEIQRFVSLAPFGMAHAPIKEMKLFQYTVPKGTPILINNHAIHHDESHWKYPHEFNPSNFLNEKGEFMKPEAFLAFSAGPRVCLGESLARMELFLFFTSILRNFQVSWPDKSGVPDLTPHYGITLSPSRFKMSLNSHQQKKQF